MVVGRSEEVSGTSEKESPWRSSGSWNNPLRLNLALGERLDRVWAQKL